MVLPTFANRAWEMTLTLVALNEVAMPITVEEADPIIQKCAERICEALNGSSLYVCQPFTQLREGWRGGHISVITERLAEIQMVVSDLQLTFSGRIFFAIQANGRNVDIDGPAALLKIVAAPHSPSAVLLKIVVAVRIGSG
jgi:hypothetical protein